MFEIHHKIKPFPRESLTEGTLRHPKLCCSLRFYAEEDDVSSSSQASDVACAEEECEIKPGKELKQLPHAHKSTRVRALVTTRSQPRTRALNVFLSFFLSSYLFFFLL